MFLNRLKTVVAVLLASGVLAAGARHAPAEEAAPRLDAQGDPLPDEAVARLGTTRLRNGDYINGLVFTPDGKTLVSDGRDGVRTWDAATGKQLRHFQDKGGYGIRERFSLSPDGALLALPLDGAIHLLEVDSGKKVRSFGGKETLYGSLRFAPDGKKLAALCAVEKESNLNDFHETFEERLEIWDATTGQKVSSGNIGEPRLSWLGWADGKTPIVASYHDNKIRLWDADAGEFRHELPVGELTVDGGLVAFSPDGALLAVICDDRRTRCVRIWDVATGKETRQLAAYVLPIGKPPPEYVSKYLTVVAFTRDGKALVTGSADDTLIFWNPATGEEVRRLATGLSSPRVLAVSPDGKTLAEARAHTVHLLDLTTGKDRLPQVGLPESVEATAVTADGRIAATSSENRVVLWDAATGKELRRVEGLPDHVAAIRTAADGRALISLGYDAAWQVHTLQTWDLPDGKELHRVEWRSNESSPSWLLALAPDGKMAAVGLVSYPKRMVLLDLDTGKELRRFDLEGEKAQIHGAAFTPDGRTVIVLSTGDNLVRLWDVSTGRQLRQFALVGAGYVAAVSPDGRHVVFGSQENFLALYDLATGREIARTDKLDDNPNNGRLMAFSPDGRAFAWKGSGPRTVHLTETATLRERCQFVAPQGEITTLAFSPDGKALVAGNSDTTALVWDLTGRLREKEAWGRPLAAADGDACWSDLAGDDAAKAYRALRKLAGSPKDAVAYLKSRLRAVPALEEKRVARLIADLDSDDFTVRENANRELEKMEEVALGFCQRALEGAPSSEARRRLEDLVKRQSDRRRNPPAQRLQTLRALETLELAGTPEARQVLEALARGAPEAEATDEAKASLERLAKRAE